MLPLQALLTEWNFSTGQLMFSYVSIPHSAYTHRPLSLPTDNGATRLLAFYNLLQKESSFEDVPRCVHPYQHGGIMGKTTVKITCGKLSLLHQANRSSTSPGNPVDCEDDALDLAFTYNSLVENRMPIWHQLDCTYPSVVIVTMVYQNAAGMEVKLVSSTFFSA
uniref:Uncharacterized protein n=1 Tax=Timema poppense TaxID=170557 RepID=A0A7R9GZ77_TIMPO|nr:unnamed protein product [Timema poppensis]